MEKVYTYSKVNKKYVNKINKEYKVVIVMLVYISIIYKILGLFNIEIIYQIYLILLFVIPFLGVYYLLKAEDNIKDVIYYIARYCIIRKIYINHFSNALNFFTNNNNRFFIVKNNNK